LVELRHESVALQKNRGKTLPDALNIGVTLLLSCQRDVPKSHWTGSHFAYGGWILANSNDIDFAMPCA